MSNDKGNEFNFYKHIGDYNKLLKQREEEEDITRLSSL